LLIGAIGRIACRVLVLCLGGSHAESNQKKWLGNDIAATEPGNSGAHCRGENAHLSFRFP
jgi:hypothetical protein